MNKLTRRAVFSLVPGAAAAVAAPSATAAPVPTPADYTAAWQKLTEVLWAERLLMNPTEISWHLKPYSGKSAASGLTRSLWEHPEISHGPILKAEREKIGGLIATGKFWPLSI